MLPSAIQAALAAVQAPAATPGAAARMVASDLIVAPAVYPADPGPVSYSDGDEEDVMSLDDIDAGTVTDSTPTAATGKRKAPDPGLDSDRYLSRFLLLLFVPSPWSHLHVSSVDTPVPTPRKKRNCVPVPDPDVKTTLLYV